MKNTLLRLFIFLLLFLLIESIIRNNRVILHDEHLINENIEEEEEEFIENNKKLKEIKIEEERRRKREINNKWENKWKNKAIKWGKTDKELIRIRFLLEQINKLIINENNTETTKNLTLEQLNELKNWKERRMNNDEIKIKKKRKGEWPEEKGEHYEGDIILNEEQLEEIIKNIKKNNNKNNKIHKRIKRKFIGSNIRRWDSKKPIIYSFDGSHTLREQKVIELALEHWHNITCLDFERKDDEPKGSRIVFTDVDGCASNVGKHPLGEPQFVSLAPECIRLGVIAHEVAHALGFWHEQSRPDRDLWVQVQWDNIDRDSKGQFLKEQPSDVDNSGVPYDYGSIMHYRSKAFAKLDDLFTIGTFISDYQKTIGQRDQLSFNDIRLMNEIYCHKVCPKQLPCQRGGYTDPRHCERCRCPDGFTGVICEQVMPGYGAECGGRIEVGNNWTIISSPNYPLEFREGQECSWLLIAPLGQKVQLQFFGEFEMYCKVRHSLCMDYVEIRNSTDFANTGMRYCCYGTPLLPIYSSTNDLLVLFRSFYRGGRGFQAKAKAINPSRNSQQQWSEWGEWTECSGNDNCGGCGIKRRNRKCILNNNNNKEEKREKDKEEEKELICLLVFAGC